MIGLLSDKYVHISDNSKAGYAGRSSNAVHEGAVPSASQVCRIDANAGSVAKCGIELASAFPMRPAVSL